MQSPAKQASEFAYPSNFTWASPYINTNEGLYEIKYVFEGSNSIFYNDYKSGSKLFLCEKPNCTHNNDSCTSWIEIPENEAFAPLLLSAGNKILLEKNATTQVGNPYIISLEKNGSNRQTIFTLPSSQQIGLGFIADEKSLYFITKNTDFAKPPEDLLVKLEIATGKSETLLKLPTIGLEIIGFDENSIFLQSIGGTTEVYSFDPSKDSELKTAFAWDNEQAPGMIIKNNAYLMQKDNTITKVNLSTLEQKEIQTIATPKDGIANLIFAFDENILLQIVKPNENGANKIQSYLVNTIDGTITQNTLKMQGENSPIMIIGTHGDFLCVQNGKKEIKWFNAGEEGLLNELFDITRNFALISKSDYINNIPNYIEFKIIQ